MWSFDFYSPGKYRVRAVYDFTAVAVYDKEIAKKYRVKVKPTAWWVKASTPFIEFEVLP